MGRTPCCNTEDLKKGAWTADEDKKLIAYIQEHGEGGWRTLPQKAGLQRCGKSCRLRWANYLRPDIKRGEFSPEDEQKIIELHAALGNRWSAIARHLTRRTDNEIKNYWNTHLKKRLSNMGIDPATHKQIIPSSGSSNDTVNKDAAKANHSPQQASGRPSSSRRSSVLAQLLNNKLTAKLATTQCLDALKSVQSDQSISNDDSNGEKDGEKDPRDDTTVTKMELPSHVLGSAENPLKMPRHVSTSARLLNKMASRVTAPLHCLSTINSILSKSIENSANDDHGTSDTFDVFGTDYYMTSSAQSSASTSTSIGLVHELVCTSHVPAEHTFDIDLLVNWEGAFTDSLEGDCVGGNDGGGGVLSTRLRDTNNIQPRAHPPIFTRNESIISGCGSSESLEFLGGDGDNDELTTSYDQEMCFGADNVFDMELISAEDDKLMEGSTNFIVDDSSCDHVLSNCSGDSHNFGENNGGPSDAIQWNGGFRF